MSKFKLSATVRLIRWNGEEIRYDDPEFAHEILSHRLGLKNASLVQTVKTSAEPEIWRCVILDSITTLIMMILRTIRFWKQQVENAPEDRQCFLVELPREHYENIIKARKKVNNNVFDLHLGLFED
ncbi:hypothetical protein IANJMKHF_00335 [Klebsiella phage CPRSA]|nr:hypothetical protein IANJMKHF_00335 [Klebsiella phage CPRSA]